MKILNFFYSFFMKRFYTHKKHKNHKKYKMQIREQSSFFPLDVF